MKDKCLISAIRALFVLALLAFSGSSALALQSQWVETEGGRMRLSIDPMPDAGGETLGVLEIDLDEGWKTYWLDPGASGIPPQIDLSGSEGIALSSMRLPAPVRVDDGYAVWAGYKGSVSYLLSFEREGAARLNARVFIGICEKICVPFQATFTLDIPAPDRVKQSDINALRLIAETTAALPAPMRADFTIDAAELNRDKKTLSVSAVFPVSEDAPEAPELFVAGDKWLFGTPEAIDASPGRATYSVPVIAGPEDAEAHRQPLLFVLTKGKEATDGHFPVN